MSILFVISFCPLFAAEVEVSADTSNFAFSTSGEFVPAKPRFGTNVSVSDQLQDNLIGAISFEASPVNGNLLAARAKWSTSFLEISAGPSFGMLNSSGSSKDIPGSLSAGGRYRFHHFDAGLCHGGSRYGFRDSFRNGERRSGISAKKPVGGGHLPSPCSVHLCR